MHEKITDRIYRINVSLPNSPLKTLNSYLLLGHERYLLIDTGFNLPASLADIQEGIKGLGLDTERTDIFLTHCHADHTGLAGRVASKHSRIWISKIDFPYIERLIGDTREFRQELSDRLVRFGYPVHDIGKSIKLNPALANNAFEMYDATPVDDDLIIDLGGFRLRAFYTPGHTPGHMCVYSDEDKILFTGDHVLFDITPNITSWPGVADSLGDYLESLDMVAGLDVRLALPSHRKPGDLKQRVSGLKRHHDIRLAEVLRILESKPGQSVYETASQMTWQIRSADWDDFPVSQKSFAVGEAHSHLRYLEIRGRATKEVVSGVEYYSVA